VAFSDIVKTLSILGEVRVRYNEHLGYFQADIQEVETKPHKDSGILVSEWGEGNTAETAVDDYYNKLKGKIVVVNAMSDNRKECIII